VTIEIIVGGAATDIKHHSTTDVVTLTQGSQLVINLPAISIVCHTYVFRVKATNGLATVYTSNIKIKLCDCNNVVVNPPSAGFSASQ